MTIILLIILLDISHSWTVELGKRLWGQDEQERRETSVASNI